MTTAILRQSGGSIILSIPKSIALAMGVGPRSEVALAVEGRTLKVAPALSIDQLLAGVTDENCNEFICSGERGAEAFD